MKYLINIFVITLFTFSLQAQEATFSLSVSTDSLLMNNYVELTFTLENASGSSFEPPSFEGFQVVGGPNQSSSYSVVNGNVSQQISYTYYLEPIEVGNYYIDPAYITVDDKVLETAPIEIIVYPNPDGIKQEIRKERSTFDIFEFGSPRTTPPPPPTKKKKKRKVYKL